MVEIGIIMGSKSDLPIMKEAVEILDTLGITSEVDIVSAHRTPEKMMSYGIQAHTRGIKVIIAGAGGAAHLPGMIAALSPLPVIGVPIKSSNSIDGWDSILSILQMPGGVPVATVALNGAKNAGIIAAQILGVQNEKILKKIINYKNTLKEKVVRSSAPYWSFLKTNLNDKVLNSIKNIKLFNDLKGAAFDISEDHLEVINKLINYRNLKNLLMMRN